MTTLEIRNKLHEYIDSASDKKVKAFYVIVEDEIENTYDNPLEDPIFLAEMDRRYENYKADPGSAKTWEEVKESARKKNAASREMRKKLHDYESPLDDPSFVAEMDRRYEAYLADPSTAVTLDEAEKRARKALAEKNRSANR